MVDQQAGREAPEFLPPPINLCCAPLSEIWGACARASWVAPAPMYGHRVHILLS